ncbi:hypothetical protein BGZ76_005120 [Entomortierella beljakovae]|nr:hypothetical protein BGZ76_005120 [Entomortierella beljakovae]
MMRNSVDTLTGRERLKNCANLIQQHLSDLNLIFDKQLREAIGEEAVEYLLYIQEAIPTLQGLSLAQLRRAIKYDAKELLELHPEQDTVKRLQSFSETEALDRMLFVDDIDISGFEDDPSHVFQQLLLPYPNLVINNNLLDNNTSNDDDLDDDENKNNIDNAQEPDSEENNSQLYFNQRTIIRPYSYKPTRFFQGFCYVEFATTELASEMSSKILARNNSVRVMPM